MAYSEFLEWAVLHTESPLGDQRDDLRMAILTSVVANAFRGKRKAYAVDDFLLKPAAEEDGSLEAKFRALTKAPGEQFNERN